MVEGGAVVPFKGPPSMSDSVAVLEILLKSSRVKFCYLKLRKPIDISS